MKFLFLKKEDACGDLPEKSGKEMGAISRAVRLAYTLDSVRFHPTMKPNPTGARKNRFVHFARAFFEIAKSGGWTEI